jgi:hypothetical protein
MSLSPLSDSDSERIETQCRFSTLAPLSGTDTETDPSSTVGIRHYCRCRMPTLLYRSPGTGRLSMQGEETHVTAGPAPHLSDSPALASAPCLSHRPCGVARPVSCRRPARPAPERVERTRCARRLR